MTARASSELAPLTAAGTPGGEASPGNVPGPIALVGSGEYLPRMAPIERALLAGRPPRYVQLATAAVPDGEQVVRKWERMGREQAERLGVEAVVLEVRERADADDRGLAEQVSGAGLVYLSGGHPSYLADTLRNSVVWAAILAAWQQGAALAGCSAGAMATAAWVPPIRGPRARGTVGLALLPHVQVVPHFDLFSRRSPDLVEALAPPEGSGVALVGIDEETAMVGGPEQWRVEGRGSVWELGRGTRTQVPAGLSLVTPLAAR